MSWNAPRQSFSSISRKVCADRELEQETGYAEVFKPLMPPFLLAHSYASAFVVTDMLMKKYVDAMPLYRQEQMWKRMGRS